MTQFSRVFLFSSPLHLFICTAVNIHKGTLTPFSYCPGTSWVTLWLVEIIWTSRFDLQGGASDIIVSKGQMNTGQHRFTYHIDVSYFIYILDTIQVVHITNINLIHSNLHNYSHFNNSVTTRCRFPLNLTNNDNTCSLGPYPIACNTCTCEE